MGFFPPESRIKGRDIFRNNSWGNFFVKSSSDQQPPKRKSKFLPELSSVSTKKDRQIFGVFFSASNRDIWIEQSEEFVSFSAFEADFPDLFSHLFSSLAMFRRNRR